MNTVIAGTRYSDRQTRFKLHPTANRESGRPTKEVRDGVAEICIADGCERENDMRNIHLASFLALVFFYWRLLGCFTKFDGPLIIQMDEENDP